MTWSSASFRRDAWGIRTSRIWSWCDARDCRQRKSQARTRMIVLLWFSLKQIFKSSSVKYSSSGFVTTFTQCLKRERCLSLLDKRCTKDSFFVLRNIRLRKDRELNQRWMGIVSCWTKSDDEQRKPRLRRFTLFSMHHAKALAWVCRRFPSWPYSPWRMSHLVILN